jgi:hypothetical protein
MTESHRETPTEPATNDRGDRRRGLLLLVIVLAGVICRVAQYIANPSFWHDEALVVVNVANKSFAELMGRLDYAQAAPPLFLFAERGLMLLLGENEYAFRLVSLLCGIASLVLFALICRRLFPGLIAPLTLAIFAFSNKLIWHSAEVKPYSGDAMVAVLLLYLGIRFMSQSNAAGGERPRDPTFGLILLSCVAAIAIWFSFPASIVFGGISLAILPAMARRGVRGWGIYIACNLLVVASFLLLFFFSIRLQHVEALSTYWVDDFPDYAHPARIPLWLAKQVYALADHPHRSFGWLILPMAVLGIYRLVISRRSFLLGVCVYPVLLAILAAFAKQYPFNGDRLTIYLVPGVFILFGNGTLFLRDRFRAADKPWRIIWPIAAVIILARGVGEASYRLVSPRTRSGARQAALYIREHRQSGEGLYLVGEPEEKSLNYRSDLCLELLCYWPQPPQPWHAGLPLDVKKIQEDRFWVMFTSQPKHDTKFINPLVEQLAPAADLREKYLVPGGGGAALLFQRKAPASRPATGPSIDRQ